MALRTQYIPVSFAEGVDNKTDSKLVVATKLTTLENGRLKVTGSIEKRDGYDLLDKSIIGGSTELDGGEALGLFKDELVTFNDSALYTRTSELGGNINRGAVNPVVVTQKAVISNSASQSKPDFHIVGNIAIYAWEDTRGGIYAKVVDLTENSTILADTQLNTTYIKPRCIVLGTYLYVFYVQPAGTAIKYRRVSLAAPTTFETEATLGSSSIDATNQYFDITPIDANRAAFAYNRSGGGITFGILDNSGSALSVSQNTGSIVEAASNCIMVKVEPTTGYIWVAYHNSTSGIRCFIRDQSFTAMLAPTTVDAQISPLFSAITGEFVSSTQMRFFYEQKRTSAGSFLPAAVNIGTEVITVVNHNLVQGQKIRFTNSGGGLPAGLAVLTDYWAIVLTADTFSVGSTLENALVGTAINLTSQGTGTHSVDPVDLYRWSGIIRTNTLTAAGSAGTASVLVYGMELASKAFIRDSQIYVNVVYPGALTEPLQPTYFLMRSDGKCTAKIQTNSAGHTSSGYLPSVYEVETDVWAWPAAVTTRIETETTRLFSVTGVVLSKTDFSNADQYFNETLGGNLLITGGYLSAYDGANVVEHGFHLFPESIISVTSTAGGLILAGTYQYAFVYEWWDNQGQRHQSAPSVPVSITTTGTTSTNRFVIESMRVTSKSGIKIGVYRTTASGSIFYRLNSISAPLDNSTSAHYVTYTDTLADTSISASEILYTSLGEIEHIAPPACNLIATNKNRAFVVSSEDPNAIYFSKNYDGGSSAVGFSDLFIKRIAPLGGDIRGIATMDDKVIAWKEPNIFYFSGDGPLNTGQQDTFTEPQLITSDGGTNEPTSIGNTSTGLYFKVKDKGIYRLNRGLEVEYVGRDIEGYKDLPITSTQIVSNLNEIRFTTSDGTALVFDYVSQQWYTFANHEAVDSIIWQNKFVWLKSDGSVFQESANSSKDNNLAIPLTVETSWMKLSGIQNFQRVRRAIFLGEYLSAHELKVSIAYDYQDYYSDIIYWDPTEVLSVDLYGGGSTYGEEDVYGGSDDTVYQVSVHVPYQKCDAIRFKIEDISSGDLGKSLRLTNMTLECGMKSGTNKVRVEKTAG